MAKIKENKLLREQVKIIYSFIKEKDYGYSVKWEELSLLINQPTLNMNNLYVILNKVNHLLMQEDNKYLETINGFGKRIILPNEHGLTSKKEIKGAVRKYRKAGAIIASTNVDKLNPLERQQIEDDAKKWRTLEMFTQQLIRKKKLDVNKPSTEDGRMLLEVIKMFQ